MVAKSAILLIVFNRPDVTKQVFDEIRKYKPHNLYIAADGPRNDEEALICKEVRNITKNVDWDCDAKYLISDKNLGCKLAVHRAINWFFQSEDQGIILEDDCLPSQSFFKYCDELLWVYKYDTRIMHIGGVSTLELSGTTIDVDYYFSKFAHIWGWATWRRAWEKYDIEMRDFKSLVQFGFIEQVFKSKYLGMYYKDRFQKAYNNEINTWDYQWYYSIWINNGLCVVPRKNLITNIGFGPNATHTKSDGGILANMNRYDYDIKYPPSIIMQNQDLDEKNAQILFSMNFLTFLILKLRSIVIDGVKKCIKSFRKQRNY